MRKQEFTEKDLLEEFGLTLSSTFRIGNTSMYFVSDKNGRVVGTVWRWTKARYNGREPWLRGYRRPGRGEPTPLTGWRAAKGSNTTKCLLGEGKTPFASRAMAMAALVGAVPTVEHITRYQKGS